MMHSYSTAINYHELSDNTCLISSFISKEEEEAKSFYEAVQSYGV